MLVGTNILLVLLSSVLVLRLIIWEFFRDVEPFFRENISDTVLAVLTLGLALGWLIPKILRRESIEKSNLNLPILFFIGAVGCSLFYTVDFPSSLMGFLVLIVEVLFFYMLLNLINTPSRFNGALIFLLGITFVVSVFGIKTFLDFQLRPPSAEDATIQLNNNNLYYLLKYPRAVSFFGWPNVLASYLLLFLPLTFTMPFIVKTKTEKIITILISLTSMICFLLTFSFLGWVSFILSLAIVLPRIWKRLGIKAWPKSYKIIITLALVFILALFMAVILKKNFISSLIPRLSYYQVAFHQLKDHPIEGSGWDTFGIICRSLTLDRWSLTSYLHNSYLQVWIEAGIIGFISIIWFTWMILKQIFQTFKAPTTDKDYWLMTAIGWGLLAFLIDNLFNYTILKTNIALFWWVMLAIFVTRPMNATKKQEFNTKSQLIMAGVILSAGIVFVILSRMLGGDILYYQAQYTHANSPIIDRYQRLTRAESLDPWSSYIPAGKGEICLKAFTMTGHKDLLKQAESDYLEAIRKSPQVFSHYMALRQIYFLLGDEEKANIFSQKAQQLSPAEFAVATAT
jgi:hypothetical protein